MVGRFFCMLFALILGALGAKIAVDRCVPDRGHRWFDVQLEMPQGFCEGVKASAERSWRESSSRRNQSMIYGGRSFSDDMRDGVEDLFLRPAFFFAQLSTARAALILLPCLCFIAFVVAFIWAQLVELMMMSGRSRNAHLEEAPTALNPTAKRRRRITATFKVLRDNTGEDDRQP